MIHRYIDTELVSQHYIPPDPCEIKPCFFHFEAKGAFPFRSIDKDLRTIEINERLKGPLLDVIGLEVNNDPAVFFEQKIDDASQISMLHSIIPGCRSRGRFSFMSSIAMLLNDLSSAAFF